MRTTIDLPDSLFHQAKLVAVQRRLSLKKLITELLETALRSEAAPAQRMTRPPIALRTSVPAITNAQLGQLMDEGSADTLVRNANKK